MICRRLEVYHGSGSYYPLFADQSSAHIIHFSRTFRWYGWRHSKVPPSLRNNIAFGVGGVLRNIWWQHSSCWTNYCVPMFLFRFSTLICPKHSAEHISEHIGQDCGALCPTKVFQTIWFRFFNISIRTKKDKSMQMMFAADHSRCSTWWRATKLRFEPPVFQLCFRHSCRCASVEGLGLDLRDGGPGCVGRPVSDDIQVLETSYRATFLDNLVENLALCFWSHNWPLNVWTWRYVPTTPVSS